MSSWANRYVPQRRNISQIPAELRPQIVPRVARPEIIASESFQENSQNEIILSTRNKEGKKTIVEPPVNPRQYITKKIDTFINPSAFELTFNNKSYVFVILRHLRNVRDNDLWISSYNSIRKFYTNKIVIIDDNSLINTVDGKLINTEIIRSEFNGAGEVLPYYYFLKYKWANKMIFLHDSMFINRPFRDSELEGDVKFHWHFDKGDIVDYRKINNYISLFKNNTELNAFVANPDIMWKGCFGGGIIIDIDIIKYLEEKYGIFMNLSLSIKSRKDRETFERILGIVLYHEDLINDTNCSNFGNIVAYPGAFESENNNIETAIHILRQKGYDTAIVKVWRGR
jgi:hypothetical protein